MDAIKSDYLWRDNQINAQINKILYLCALQGVPIVIPRSDRVTLARLFHQLDFKVGAEIGVGSGPYSATLCLYNPGVKLYCIDAWQPYSGYADFTNPQHLESDYNTAVSRLSPYNAHFIRSMSLDAVKEFKHGSLDFVYIDANHDAPYIEQDIEAWSKVVRSGGIVSGHDYVSIHKDVITAVNRYTSYNHIQSYLVGNPSETSDVDSICSWFWLNP